MCYPIQALRSYVLIITRKKYRKEKSNEYGIQYIKAIKMVNYHFSPCICKTVLFSYLAGKESQLLLLPFREKLGLVLA